MPSESPLFARYQLSLTPVPSAPGSICDAKPVRLPSRACVDMGYPEIIRIDKETIRGIDDFAKTGQA